MQHEDLKRLAAFFFLALAFLFVTPAIIVFLVRKNYCRQLWPRSRQRRIIISCVALVPALGLIFLNFFWSFKVVLYLIFAFWSASYAIAILVLPLFKFKNITITTKMIGKHSSPEASAALQNPDPALAFIGQSMVSFDPVFLHKKMRVMHSLIVGATGSGKTTLLSALFEYDCKNQHPVIIIDPKGNDQTIDSFRRKALSLGIPGDRFKVFSLAKPESSCFYNPLKHGSPVQIKDRLMGALVWSEPYYKTQAEIFLLNTIQILYYLKKEISVDEIISILNDSDSYMDLKDEVDKASGIDPLLLVRLKDCIGNLRLILANKKDLAGLNAQLLALQPIELGLLLSPEQTTSPEKCIDLVQSIRNKEIIYFSLNVMNYGETAPVVGRLLLQELKSITSQVHAGAVTVETDFLAVYIDEFGSFAFKEFIDFQKMCRDVGFALHMFFQGLADLDAVSPEFKAQVQQNCINKLILRCDSPEEVDFWAAVAGTRDSIEQSYQVEDSLVLQTKTGMGNQRKTKEMLVEHDVFKMLSIGQAVLIQKSPHNVDLINLYRPKTS